MFASLIGFLDFYLPNNIAYAIVIVCTIVVASALVYILTTRINKPCVKTITSKHEQKPLSRKRDSSGSADSVRQNSQKSTGKRIKQPKTLITKTLTSQIHSNDTDHLVITAKPDVPSPSASSSQEATLIPTFKPVIDQSTVCGIPFGDFSLNNVPTNSPEHLSISETSHNEWIDPNVSKNSRRSKRQGISKLRSIKLEIEHNKGDQVNVVTSEGADVQMPTAIVDTNHQDIQPTESNVRIDESNEVVQNKCNDNQIPETSQPHATEIIGVVDSSVADTGLVPSIKRAKRKRRSNTRKKLSGNIRDDSNPRPSASTELLQTDTVETNKDSLIIYTERKLLTTDISLDEAGYEVIEFPANSGQFSASTESELETSPAEPPRTENLNDFPPLCGTVCAANDASNLLSLESEILEAGRHPQASLLLKAALDENNQDLRSSSKPFIQTTSIKPKRSKVKKVD